MADKTSIENHFVEANDGQSVEELLSRSEEQPPVIFKHSLTYVISRTPDTDKPYREDSSKGTLEDRRRE